MARGKAKRTDTKGAEYYVKQPNLRESEFTADLGLDHRGQRLLIFQNLKNQFALESGTINPSFSTHIHSFLFYSIVTTKE